MHKDNIGLVIQGGSLRSIFTAGVLDAFIAMDFNPFNYYCGVSGGAMCLSYYLSGQYRDTFKVIRQLSQDDKFLGIRNLLFEEGYLNLSYLEEYTTKHFPLNLDNLKNTTSEKTVEIVATDLESGDSVYLQPNPNNWLQCLKASATLPFLTRGFCQVGDRKLMDGGWSDPIPVKRAIENNVKKIVVIMTLPEDHRLSWTYLNLFGSLWHMNNDALSKRFSDDHINYNNVIEFLNSEHCDVEVFKIAPPEIIKSGAYSASVQDLDNDYRLGVEMGVNFVMKHREQISPAILHSVRQDYPKQASA